MTFAKLFKRVTSTDESKSAAEGGRESVNESTEKPNNRKFILNPFTKTKCKETTIGASVGDVLNDPTNIEIPRIANGQSPNASEANHGGENSSTPDSNNEVARIQLEAHVSASKQRLASRNTFGRSRSQTESNRLILILILALNPRQ